MSLKIFSIHKKEAVSFNNTQDKYAYKTDLSSIALSDGATQGYESGAWANILVNSYINNPSNRASTFLRLLIQASTSFNRELNQKNIKVENKAIESLIQQTKEKGSYCTFIGVEINGHNVQVASYGDSVLFHFRNGELIHSIPTDNSSILDEYSNFLNTNVVEKTDFFVEKNFISTSLSLEKDDVVVLASDAFSKYMLDNHSSLNDLFQISSFDDFYNYIDGKWNNDSLEDDDISIVIYKHDDSNNVVVFEPDVNFRFKEKKPIKKPVSPVSKGPENTFVKYILSVFLLVFAVLCVFYFLPSDSIAGCTDDQACNYDETAIEDDGKCEYSSCAGCTDSNACNYGGSAITIDDGSCKFPQIHRDCQGKCVDDLNNNGICDQEEEDLEDKEKDKNKNQNNKRLPLNEVQDTDNQNLENPSIIKEETPIEETPIEDAPIE
jgi:serine/threonine protein phosphatase PrpC